MQRLLTKLGGTFVAVALVSMMIAGLAYAADKSAAKEVAAKDKNAAEPLKALLITGGCCHDYPRQTKIITEGISQRANVTWDVVHAPDAKDTKVPVYQNHDWIKDYDIIVHNECYGGVTDVKFVEGVAHAHRDSGVPAVVIHCSMHSYREADTDEWRKLLGVTSRRHERVKRPLDVVNRAADHPIMHGFPKEWQTPNGELYVIEKTWPDHKTLATAQSVETKSDEPCIWINTFGKARIFGTTLGHHNETMAASQWLDVVSRGLLWACGKLGDDGQPAAGYAGTGIAPFTFEVEDPAQQPTVADWSGSVKFPAEEKPVKLFNGKDLKGWTGHTGQDGYFNVVDGVIVAKNAADNAPTASTYLLTKKKYSDFRLVFEGRLVESKMHSGIALWGEVAPEMGDDYTYRGHLVMFPSNWGFYDLYRRNLIMKDDGRAKKADNGGWNRMEILAIGPRIRLVVNGQLVADWTDDKPEYVRPGPIGLQLHKNTVAQEVQFRGLILAENPQDKLITVAP